MRPQPMPNPTITWELYPDEPHHTLDSLMAVLIHRYMPELVYFSSPTGTSDDAQDRLRVNYLNAPVKPRIDAAIEDYVGRLPLSTQSQLREEWGHAYDPNAIGGKMSNRWQQTSISCQLYDVHDQTGLRQAEVTLRVPLALMFTLLWRAIQDKSQWPTPEGSTPETQKALRIARFDWINQLYFFMPFTHWLRDNNWRWRPPYPWLQLLDGFQGKSLLLEHQSIQPTPIDIFLYVEFQQEIQTFEKIYDRDWLPNDLEKWVQIFVEYWHVAKRLQIEIIEARLFNILAMLHYRTENYPSEALTNILTQINTKIVRSPATTATAPSSSTSTSVQTVEPASSASNLAQHLATKSLFPEDSMLVTAYIAQSPRMPANAIAWLLSKEHGFDIYANKKTWGKDHPATPLELACYHGHPALVQHLLHIDVDESAVKRRLSAIKFAAHHRDLVIVNLLWDSLSSTQITADYPQNLALACEDALRGAANRGHIDVLRWLLQHIPGLKNPPYAYYDERHYGSLLFWAVVYGHADVVQSLLDKGANMHEITPDKASLTALSACAIWGRVDSLRLMLDHARTHNQMPDARYIGILAAQGLSKPAIISLLIERGLFVLSGTAPVTGQVEYRESSEPKFPYGNYRDISGKTAHQRIVNLAPECYRPIVRKLVDYIRTRDALPPQPIFDHLAKHGIKGYPKAVKLHVAHQMVAALLSENPQAVLDRLSVYEQNALQQSDLGKIYRAYTSLTESPSTLLSKSSQLWRATIHEEEESQIPVPTPQSSPSSSNGH